MKTKDELKNQITKSAEYWAKVQTSLFSLIDWLPDSLVEKATTSYSDPQIIIISLPYSTEALCKARKELGKGWKRLQVWGDVNPTLTYKCYKYSHPYFSHVYVRFDLDLKPDNGSTCKLNLVSEKIVPVYEVVCGDPS